jgi:hypothetical protein
MAMMALMMAASSGRSRDVLHERAVDFSVLIGQLLR